MQCSQLFQQSNNHIDLVINDVNGDWRLTGYYGYPDRSRRHLLWNLLRHLSRINNLSWVCMGDFNDLLTSEDKKGRVSHPQWLFRGFREAVNDSQLSDIPLSGYNFTWFRGRGTANAVEERLDRAMGNPAWHDRFNRASLQNLVAPVSDHNPILLSTEPLIHHSNRRNFRFENRWLAEKDIRSVVCKC